MRCAFGLVIPALCAGVVLCSTLSAFAGEGTASSPAPAKVKVLIIDGQNNHKWAETTPAIKAMLEKTGRFAVDVATTPARKAPPAEWEKFRPKFADYDAVLLNYFGQPWPAEVKESFEKYVKGGGGLVFYHAAAASFPDWKQFNEMMGMGWRKAEHGMRLTVDGDGKEVRTPAGEGIGSGHGPRHSYEIVIRDGEHPITRGLPAKLTHVADELWQGLRGPLKRMRVLATAFADKSVVAGRKGKFKPSETNEPVVWTVSYGKGRVMVTVLGHDVAATTAPESAIFISRGLEWVATGKVTLPPAKGLPSKTK